MGIISANVVLIAPQLFYSTLDSIKGTMKLLEDRRLVKRVFRVGSISRAIEKHLDDVLQLGKKFQV